MDSCIPKEEKKKRRSRVCYFFILKVFEMMIEVGKYSVLVLPFLFFISRFVYLWFQKLYKRITNKLTTNESPLLP